MIEINITTIVIVSTLIFIIILVLFRLFTNNISRTWNRHKAETVDKWEEEGLEFICGPKAAQFGGLESMGITNES